VIDYWVFEVGDLMVGEGTTASIEFVADTIENSMRPGTYVIVPKDKPALTEIVKVPDAFTQES
jgi:hypothetical protein